MSLLTPPVGSDCGPRSEARIDLSKAVAFSPEVHKRHLRKSLPERGYSTDAVLMTESVQGPADNRFTGFKDNGRLWMHFMEQMFGIDASACSEIRVIVELSG